MIKRKLGCTGEELTVIGLGAWAIGGGGWDFGWGPQDDEESIATIRRALDLGINWIDTAAVYGFGHSEEVVGRAIQGRRDDLFLATKCGLLRREGTGTPVACLKADSVRREAEASLRRLRVEVIDLYQIHWPEPEDDIEEAWEVIAALIREGKIRYGGVSNFDTGHMDRVRSIYTIASLQPPYSMIARGVETALLRFCAEHEIGVVAYSPMAVGLLTGKMTRERIARFPEDDWRRGAKNFQEPRLSANLRLAEKLGRVAERFGRPLSQLAIAWVLRRPEVTSAIVGARSPRQIEETSGAGDWQLSNETIEEIEGLLQEYQQSLPG